MLNSLLRYSLLLAAGIGTSAAHHASQPLYDMTQTVTLEAEVVRLELVNPHMQLFVTVIDADGEAVEWIIDGPGRLSLARHGWTPETFLPGDMITVTGKQFCLMRSLRQTARNTSIRPTRTIWLSRRSGAHASRHSFR